MKAYSTLAKAYNELMADVDYNAWAAYIGELIGKSGARIYETACGTGALTCRLYDMGFDIVASDLSADMLQKAAQTARETGRDITFAQQDMRHLEAGKKADAVIAACDGVNYLDTQGFSQFAAAAYRALKDGGMLLFDISTKAKLKAMDAQVYFDDSDDVSCIWKNTFDTSSDTLTMDLTLFVRNGSLFERTSETHVQHAHDTALLRCTLEQAGFKDVAIYDFLSKTPCPDNAPRAQFVCRK